MTDDWNLLRVKADQAAADDDWVGSNTVPAFTTDVGGGFAVMPVAASRERQLMGVEIKVVGVDADRAPVNRGAMTCDVTLIDLMSRSDPQRGGAAGLDPILGDTTFVDNVPLQAITYVPFNGGMFTVRITDNAAIAGGITDLEIWWRPVTR